MELYKCGCPVEPGQPECSILEPHATIACYLGDLPGEPGPAGPTSSDQGAVVWPDHSYCEPGNPCNYCEARPSD